MKSYDLLKQLREARLSLFTTQEVRRLTGQPSNAIRLWLIRMIKQRHILPLKKRHGIYCLSDQAPHEWLIANRLYAPSYISLESALSYFGILPEAVYSVTSVTTKTTRTLVALGKEYAYHKIKRLAFTGYLPITIDQQTILIAEREKALADYLYFVHLGRKILNERLKLSSIRLQKLKKYLALFNRPNLVAWSKNVIS